MSVEIIPTNDEVKAWLESTLRHSCLVEFYLNELNVGLEDPERPHDIVGRHNKFTWPVTKGLALEYRENADEGERDYIDRQLAESIRLHEEQYHHRKWLGPDPSANRDAMMVGAIDSICTHLDGRLYNGGPKSWAQIAQIISSNGPEHAKWMREAFHMIRNISSPDLSLVTLHNIPFDEVHLPDRTYDRICQRVEQVVSTLNKHKGYNL